MGKPSTVAEVVAWAQSQGLDAQTTPPNEHVVAAFNQAHPANLYTGPKTVFGKANRP